MGETPGCEGKRVPLETLPDIGNLETSLGRAASNDLGSGGGHDEAASMSFVLK